MPTREEYNGCMSPYMTGQKTKKERQHDMCVGAKICSGKAQTTEDAEKLCSVPKLPKWAKGIVPVDVGKVSCEDRITRIRENIDTIQLKVKEGDAEGAKPVAAQVMNDVFTCLPEPAIVEMVEEAMGEFGQLAKGFYFTGEGKGLQGKLDTLKEVLV